MRPGDVGPALPTIHRAQRSEPGAHAPVTLESEFVSVGRGGASPGTTQRRREAPLWAGGRRVTRLGDVAPRHASLGAALFEPMKKILHGVGLVVARALLLFVLGMGVIGEGWLGDDMFKSGWRSVALIVGLLGVLDVGLILRVGLLGLGKVSLRGLGWRFDRVGRDVALGVAGFALAAGVLIAALLVTGEHTLPSLGRAIASYSITERLIYLCIAVFGAALVEESLFRGYLQGALTEKIGLAPAIIVQAIVFDLMHMNLRPASLVVKLVFGIVFGVLRGRDRSLLAPAVAHGLLWAVIGAP